MAWAGTRTLELGESITHTSFNDHSDSCVCLVGIKHNLNQSLIINDWNTRRQHSAWVHATAAILPPSLDLSVQIVRDASVASGATPTSGRRNN